MMENIDHDLNHLRVDRYKFFRMSLLLLHEDNEFGLRMNISLLNVSNVTVIHGIAMSTLSF